MDADVDDAYPVDDQSSSYHLLFLGLTDPAKQATCESEEEDQDGELTTVQGTETFGCSVAVCLLAPLALIKLDSLVVYPSGGRTFPGIEGGFFDEQGRARSHEAWYREHIEAETLRVLDELRAAIVRVLTSLDIAILPAAEAAKVAPWLRAGEEVFVGKPSRGEDITVGDAFFFRGL